MERVLVSTQDILVLCLTFWEKLYLPNQLCMLIHREPQLGVGTIVEGLSSIELMFTLFVVADDAGDSLCQIDKHTRTTAKVIAFLVVVRESEKTVGE